MDFWVFEIKFFDAWIAIGAGDCRFACDVLKKWASSEEFASQPAAGYHADAKLWAHDWLNLDRNEVNTF